MSAGRRRPRETDAAFRVKVVQAGAKPQHPIFYGPYSQVGTAKGQARVHGVEEIEVGETGRWIKRLRKGVTVTIETLPNEWQPVDWELTP